MTIQDIQEHYEPIKMICDRVFEIWDRKTARDLLHLFKHEILTDENIKSEAPVIEKYQSLSSRLRAVSFINAASEDSPGIFLNDILYVLDRTSDDVMSDLDTFFVRFQDPDNFTKYQKLGMDNLLLNKQRLSSEPIVAGEERKVTPTVSNWLKYFYYQVGGGTGHSRLQIAEFFGKDQNIVKLKLEELNRLKNLISTQEFLRIPAREIMQMHQDALFDFGNGIMASFEDGEFYLLEDEDTLRKRLYQEREIKKYDGEVEPVKEAPVQVIPELKPISTSNSFAVDDTVGADAGLLKNTDEKISDSLEPEMSKSDSNSMIVEELKVSAPFPKFEIQEKGIIPKIEDALNQSPKKAENHSIEDGDRLILSALEFDPELERFIDEARLEIEHGGLSFENLLKIAHGVLDEPDMAKIIALLELVSRENMIEKIMTDPIIQRALTLFVQSSSLSVDSTRGGLIAVLIRMFVEGAADGSSSDSARVLARMIDLLPAEFHESLEAMIYYDRSVKTFVWE